MLAIYATEQTQADFLRDALPSDQPAIVFNDWEEFEQAAHAASCSVVYIPWLRSDPAFARLSAFKIRHPNHPVALATRYDPDNARSLLNVFVDEVLWHNEIMQDLSSVVAQICSHDFNYVRCLAVPFAEADHIPSALRTALAHACKNEPPIPTVNALAQRTGCDRRTLWNQWKEAVGSSSALRLQDFLQWIVLMRAVGRKTRTRSWAQVAAEVNVHPQTLGRYAKHLAGHNLSELHRDGPAILAHLFRQRVLGFLLDEAAMDIQ
jgi:AraC-like DNA-binding protein